MAKSAATENELGGLHSQLTKIFSKVLNGYEAKLLIAEGVLSDLDENSDAEDVVSALMAADVQLPPAMLSAVAKFLKDNEISVDSEELDKLSAQEERLRNRKAVRPDLKSITNLSVIEGG